MAAKKRKPKNHLADKTANVALHRNGLTIEIPNVNATDAPYVAAALLDAARRLVKRGYEELVQDAGGVHGGHSGNTRTMTTPRKRGRSISGSRDDARYQNLGGPVRGVGATGVRVRPVACVGRAEDVAALQA